ncbi:MAG: VWA domain-containing protein, partial [Aggregatilineales bacterium]
MKTRLLLIVALLAAVLAPVAIALTQGADPAAQLEITGVNPTELPLVRVVASVRDAFGQPITGLTAADFAIAGELAGRAQIVSVSSVVDASLPIWYVLVIDISSSMENAPIQAAKEAARAFVETLSPIDPVALITFASTVQLAQDFTTDRDAILNAIDAIAVGGQTSLYEAALLGVQKAAEAGERRLVVLLSDGAQYDTRNPQPTAPREAAAEAAARLGVPVYAVGLGFGTDRSYLQALADSTSARFVESPTPQELRAAFESLAQMFRSQYEIVIRADVPADGTVYELVLEAATAQGRLADDAILRAPVPVPVLRVPILLDQPISQPVEMPVEVLADDGIASVEALIDGVSVGLLPTAPYRYTVDPADLLPGPHSLTFIATDTDGDIGTASIAFEVAALPPVVTFSADLPPGDLREITVIEVSVTGQT